MNYHSDEMNHELGQSCEACIIQFALLFCVPTTKSSSATEIDMNTHIVMFPKVKWLVCKAAVLRNAK